MAFFSMVGGTRSVICTWRQCPSMAPVSKSWQTHLMSLALVLPPSGGRVPEQSLSTGHVIT